MIKHKREVFLSDTKHRAFVLSGLFWGCATVDLLGMSLNRGTVILMLLFGTLSVFLLLSGVKKAGEQKRKAMESRQNYIDNGVVSHGKVTSVGGGYYQKRHYRQRHIKHQQSRNFYVWEGKWWAEIEYYNEVEGIYDRFTATDLNKNAKWCHLVGKEVDLYHLDKSIYVDFK